MGANTGALVVHGAKMPTQYILARESMHVQCDGALADVKMLPAFTAKRSPGCFGDVLHDILEGNPNMQLVVVRPVAKTCSTYLSIPKLPWMRMAARRRCTLRTRMTTGAWPSEQMPPRGLSEKHIMARTFAEPPLPVHAEGSKFVNPRLLPPKRLPSSME